jgi:hypothetical protein
MLVALAGEKPRGTTPEGLSPIETGKKRHQHGVAAHEQTEGSNGHGEADSRNSRMVQIGEAVLLALVTVTAAWAGTQRHAGVQHRG